MGTERLLLQLATRWLSLVNKRGEIKNANLLPPTPKADERLSFYATAALYDPEGRGQR